nr:MAG TPA: hypothetical protein [Caudoviricetes sp.]
MADTNPTATMPSPDFRGFCFNGVLYLGKGCLKWPIGF